MRGTASWRPAGRSVLPSTRTLLQPVLGSATATKWLSSRRSPEARMTVRVQTGDFDAGAEMSAMRKGNPKIGAIASFVGVVRDLNEGADIAEMTLEHYPGMTDKALETIIEDARTRWDIYDALVVHRVGALTPTEQIVLVIVAGAHRGDAVQAC